MKNLPKSIVVFGRKIKISTKPYPNLPKDIQGYYDREEGIIHVESGGMECFLPRTHTRRYR